MNQTKIKICGLSHAEDIDAVNSAAPDYIGFVFAPSRRKVNMNTAVKLKERLNPGVTAVGVFVNEDIKTVAEIYNNGIIEIVQLHGDEDSEYIKMLRTACGCRIIKAIRVGEIRTATWQPPPGALLPQPLPGSPLSQLPPGAPLSLIPPGAPLPKPLLQALPAPDYMLFDALTDRHGGAGEVFDWNILAEYTGPPYFLAGGLTINNVTDAIRRLSPFGVDVSSGVETDGRKDAAKIESFVRMVRGLSQCGQK